MSETFPILSILIFVPLVGFFLILPIDRRSEPLIRSVALTTALVDFFISVALVAFFRLDGDPQFVERHEWIPTFGIEYHLGVDGISIFLVALTTLTSLLCIVSSYSAIKERVKEFMSLLLLLQVGMLGVFLALDFFLFYIFLELTLVPIYFIIGIWGGPRRIYAALKFFIYTALGSLLMLIGIVWLYFHFHQETGYYSSSIFAYYSIAIPIEAQLWLFAAFFIAFGIKTPIFPFHTWLPDAHVEAPTAGSVILAGILLKIGTYGFLRFALPIFPDAARMAIEPIMVLAVISIIYGSWVATVQRDVKKLIAYSSVAHLGFVMIGIFAMSVESIEGAILQMINHGVSTGALFFAVGILYERRHSRMIADFGGISAMAPVFATVFMIVALSSIGLPGMNGFVGEFLIFLGAWRGYPLYVILAATGVVWGAVYMLWMFQRVMFEKSRSKSSTLTDLSARELAYFAPLIALIFFIGLYPRPILERIEPSARKLIDELQTPRFSRADRSGLSDRVAFEGIESEREGARE